MLSGFLVMPTNASSDLNSDTPPMAWIEFRQLVELELVDHLDGEIARQDELRLAGHRFLIDGAAVEDVLVGVGAQEHVVAADNEDARLGLIFRRDQHRPRRT